jgi:cardiolipin synthase
MWMPHVDFGTAYYVVEWIIRLGALAIVPMGRAPAATRSWLLLIFFLPVPGLLLFLAIGRSRFPAWRAERFRLLQPFFLKVSGHLETAAPCDQGVATGIAALAQTLGYLDLSP